jgi:hypothetical protein
VRTQRSAAGSNDGGFDEIEDRIKAIVTPCAESRQAIRGEIIGSKICEAEGYTVRGAAPVLVLCRKLIEAGYDPGRSLHAYRGAVHCLTVGSIGEAARLAVDEGRAAFALWKPFPGAAVSLRIKPFKQAATHTPKQPPKPRQEAPQRSSGHRSETIAVRPAKKLNGDGDARQR